MTLDLADLEAAVERAVRKAIEGLTPSPLPSVLTYRAAAKELSVGLTKLKELVRDGALSATKMGRRRGIARHELERFLKRQEAPLPASGRTRRVSTSAAQEAEIIRAAIRGRP